MPFISMRRPIPVSVQNRKSWTWQSWWPAIQRSDQPACGEFYRHSAGYIYEKCPHDELTIIMRRYMMMIAEHFANENEMLGTDNRREHWPGGKPDHAEPGSHQ